VIPYLQDSDLTLYCGDALEVLRELPDESVDCVVTSPPYWGLRDYGTGEWEGGEPECDHLGEPFRTKAKLNENWGGGFSDVKNAEGREPMRQECSKCGARRIDHQLGLEATPELYVERVVEVFREVRRVLAKHGTCWVNLGDSYNSAIAGRPNRTISHPTDNGGWETTHSLRLDYPGLKPKDLCGVPWRVAFALQADGWWLRSEIIWAKPNPMPESVTDRPTKAHELIFLLTKAPRYFFDQEAVRERFVQSDTKTEFRAGSQPYIHQVGPVDNSRGPDGRRKTTVQGADGSIQHRDGERWPNGGRNCRTVWEIATQPFPEAHFATYPEELVRRCILAGCPEQVCRVCGKPRERVVERTAMAETIGWTSCSCADYRPGIVFDPFLGSGTTALVARKHGRHAVGIELSPDYCAMAAKRLAQLSLLTEGGVA
jgi:site-specific DNA-methyltransferase (cytosine-N4-specific)